MRISDWSSDVCASDLLMMMPDMLLVENYRTMHQLGLVDSIAGIALPYMASGFGIFLLRQAFKTVPGELEEAARLDGCRSEERRVGKECVRTCRTRGLQYD